MGNLEVLEHPEIGEPARLEMFSDEFERLQAAERVVRLRWTGARKAQELTVLQEQFDVLPRVDYSTLEHAGEPHRGRITEAEKQIVREHLDEVNRRLNEQDIRMIDPADPDMQRR